jgi:hypothetical protein
LRSCSAKTGGDVDEHGPRVLTVWIGLRPPLHPDGLTIVFAAKLELYSRALFPALDGRQGLIDASLRLRRGG